MSESEKTIQEQCYGTCWGAQQRIDELTQQLNAANERIKRLEDCAETAWGVIANVDSGNWGEQRSDWREAAIRWRDDQFHPAFGLTKHKAKEVKP